MPTAEGHNKHRGGHEARTSRMTFQVSAKKRQSPTCITPLTWSPRFEVGTNIPAPGHVLTERKLFHLIPGLLMIEVTQCKHGIWDRFNFCCAVRRNTHTSVIFLSQRMSYTCGLSDANRHNHCSCCEPRHMRFCITHRRQEPFVSIHGCYDWVWQRLVGGPPPPDYLSNPPSMPFPTLPVRPPTLHHWFFPKFYPLHSPEVNGPRQPSKNTRKRRYRRKREMKRLEALLD